MVKKYRHLTELDRAFLSQMLGMGYRKDKIAKILGFDRSTIYREIKRNIFVPRYSGETLYHSWYAQSEYRNRRKKRLKLYGNNSLTMKVQEKLSLGWSPWQIEGRLKRENGGKSVITHESIYRYVYRDAAIRNRYYKKLRRKHFCRIRKNSRKRRIPEDMLIENRPDEINYRDEFGHWECDLMMFKHGVKTNLITLRERKTRYILAIKNDDKSARTTALAIIRRITKLKRHIKSITFDQGTEFNKYEWIKDCIGADIYFCKPASPYQKGTVENGNGVIRTEFQRDYNINELKQKNIDAVISNINDRPLKCLNYQTPTEVFKVMCNG
jgi:IS30 family transposase